MTAEGHLRWSHQLVSPKVKDVRQLGAAEKLHMVYEQPPWYWETLWITIKTKPQRSRWSSCLGVNFFFWLSGYLCSWKEKKKSIK